MNIGRIIETSIYVGSLLIGFAILVGAWQFAATRKAKAAITTGTEYRRLAEEYRRLAEMAITAQEHTDLKLGDMTMRIDQVRGQVESVQRILKEVE
jgi:hypothetical protein